MLEKAFRIQIGMLFSNKQLRFPRIRAADVPSPSYITIGIVFYGAPFVAAK